MGPSPPRSPLGSPERGRGGCPSVTSPLPRLEEGGRRKCGQYWPLEKDSHMSFGALTVTNLGVENLGHYKKTILEIHSSEVRAPRPPTPAPHTPGRGPGANPKPPPCSPPGQGAAAAVPLPVPELAGLRRPLLGRHPHRLFGGGEAAAAGGRQRFGAALQGAPGGPPARGALQRRHRPDG